MSRSGFLPGVLLALIFVATKLAICWPLESLKGLGYFVAISAEDIIVAVCFGLLSAVALAVTARDPRTHRWTWRIIMGVGAVFALYAVLNVGVYHSFGYPLNARMFALAGNFFNLRSSVAARCSAGLVAGMILAPTIYLIVSRFRVRTIGTRAGRVAWLATAAVWVICGMVLRAQADPSHWVRRAGKSPHREMLASFVSRIWSDREIDLSGEYPAAYVSDFKPAATRQLPALPQFSPGPKNVIFVVLESTCAKYISLYGAPYDTTPNLIAESRNALVYDQFYAHVGYTFCSMMPLVYSVYPGLPDAFLPKGVRVMPPGLATVLKEKGYRTGFLATADPEWQGIDIMAKLGGFEEVIGPEQLKGPEASSWGTEDGAMIDGLIRWIDAAPDRPFFAIAWTDQTHDPYTLSKETVARKFVAPDSMRHGGELNRYLNAIGQADRHLGRLFAALRERKLADDTLVVITGDHGEAFGDLHDVMGHGSGLFEENLRVPLMLWNPRLFPAGQRISKPSGHVDLNPTVAHLMGITPPAEWQGASLMASDHPNRVYLMADLSGRQFGLRDERYKYMLYASEGYERLFDLQADPTEQHDLSKKEGGLTKEMRARLSAFMHTEDQYLQALMKKR